jgi:hypothetical protein
VFAVPRSMDRSLENMPNKLFINITCRSSEGR